MPVEIRVTGLDDPRDVGVDGARPALLSALAPRADHPAWDVAVWLDILSFPGTPAADRAYRDIERWVFANYRPPYAAGASRVVQGLGVHRARRVDEPQDHRAHRARRVQPAGTAAVRTLDRLDPHDVFTSPLLRALLRTR